MVELKVDDHECVFANSVVLTWVYPSPDEIDEALRVLENDPP